MDKILKNFISLNGYKYHLRHVWLSTMFFHPSCMYTRIFFQASGAANIFLISFMRQCEKGGIFCEYESDITYVTSQALTE